MPPFKPARRASAAKPCPCGSRTKARDARRRQARQFRQGLREETPFSAKQRTQEQGRRERSGRAQRARKLRPLVGTA